MNKTKLVTLSVIATAALTMTGCGSSSGSSSNPTATPTPAPTVAPTNTPAPTPAPTATPVYDKKAPITQASVQRLVQNNAVLQSSNTATAAGESTATMVLAQATRLFSGFVISTWAGDLPCSVFGKSQGSGSIKASATTATTGKGVVYTVDFQECKFDTDFILKASSSETNVHVPKDCRKMEEKLDDMVAYNDNTMESNVSITPAAISDLNTTAYGCADAMDNISLTGDKDKTGEYVKSYLGTMISLLAVSDEFNEKIKELGLDGNVFAALGAPLNDHVTVTGSLTSRVYTIPAGGNVWDTEFATSNLNLSWKDNAEKVEKLSFNSNGKMTGTAFALIKTDNNPTPKTQNGTFKMGATSNIKSAFNITTSKFGGLYFDAAIESAKSAHSFEMAYNASDVGADGTFGNTWNEMEDAHWNDAGDGRITATARDNSNGWEGEVTLNNKKFTQERIVVGDNTDTSPSANDRTRMSTLNINGEFGAVFKGLPIVWNTAGLFNFNTATLATRSIYDNVANAPVIESGFMTIGGENGDIEVEFTANTVLMRVLGGTTTTLPANLPFWAQMFPQP